jgi:hypothetical protein
MIGEVLENFRLRINIAPNYLAGFSTFTYLLSMGFDSSQYEKRRYKNENFEMEKKKISSFWGNSTDQNPPFPIILGPTLLLQHILTIIKHKQTDRHSSLSHCPSSPLVLQQKANFV